MLQQQNKMRPKRKHFGQQRRKFLRRLEIGGSLAGEFLEDAVEGDAIGKTDLHGKSIDGVIGQESVADEALGFLHTIGVHPTLEIGVLASIDGS